MDVAVFLMNDLRNPAAILDAAGRLVLKQTFRATLTEK
jgi:hypothetical protein